jgi:CRISPR/Cas system-associated endoribonuclease Cas2
VGLSVFAGELEDLAFRTINPEAYEAITKRIQELADDSDVAITVATLTGAMEGVAESTTLANVSYSQLLRELLPVPDRPDQPVALPLVLGGS